MNINKGDALRKHLCELEANHDLPVMNKDRGSEFVRAQETNDSNGVPYKEGFFFGAPDISQLGRYNDPNMNLEVCYVADTAATALAEVYGRRQNRNIEDPESFHIDSCELDSKSITKVEATKDLKLLNMGKLLTKLGKTTDQISNVDYQLPQEIVKYFSESDNRTFDGIAYRSRHFDDGSFCYALWNSDNEPNVLKTKSITSIEEYKSMVDSPDDWEYEDISGEEILTDVLGFQVV
jgi:hypothetical protein